MAEQKKLQAQESKNLHQRLSAITTELSAVAKNLTIQTGKNQSYKAVSEADVLAAVKPLEAKHGIYSYPYGRDELISEFVEKESTYNGEVKKRIEVFIRVKTIYRFVNIDAPNEFIDIISYGDGVDGQDKAPGKAMTYADKYALLKAYKIITGDDPDQYASEDMKSVNRGIIANNKVQGKDVAQTNADNSTPISADMLEFIRTEIDVLEVDYEKFCNAYGVLKIEDLKGAKISEAVQGLAMKRAAVERANKKAAAQDKTPTVNTDTLFENPEQDNASGYAELEDDNPFVGQK